MRLTRYYILIYLAGTSGGRPLHLYKLISMLIYSKIIKIGSDLAVVMCYNTIMGCDDYDGWHETYLLSYRRRVCTFLNLLFFWGREFTAALVFPFVSQDVVALGFFWFHSSRPIAPGVPLLFAYGTPERLSCRDVFWESLRSLRAAFFIPFFIIPRR